MALHSPDQTKEYQKDILARVSRIAFAAKRKLSNNNYRARVPKSYLRADRHNETWALAFVSTRTKTDLEGKVIAIIGGEEFKDITDRFLDGALPYLSKRELARLKKNQETKWRQYKIVRDHYKSNPKGGA